MVLLISSLLALLVLLAVPTFFLLMGLALTLWLVWLVGALVWGVLCWLTGDPFLALVAALFIGLLIGRRSASRNAVSDPRR